MLLIDAGCEYAGYASDITVTWPASGRFTEAQAKVYEAVLRVQQDVVAAVRPGATFKQLNTIACEGLLREMQALGLVDAERSIDELMEAQAYKPYYMHSIGHWIGMDVHDVGSYGKDRSRPFEPGMVLTVEPGIYIAPDAPDAPAELRGIAVRIEDDIAVTTGEPEKSDPRSSPHRPRDSRVHGRHTRLSDLTDPASRPGRSLFAQRRGPRFPPLVASTTSRRRRVKTANTPLSTSTRSATRSMKSCRSITNRSTPSPRRRSRRRGWARLTIQEAHLTKALKGTKPEQIVPISVKTHVA